MTRSEQTDQKYQTHINMGAAVSAIEEKKEIGEGPGFEEEAKVKANVYLNKGPIILDSFELLKVIERTVWESFVGPEERHH
jgi:hypothetical protein